MTDVITGHSSLPSGWIRSTIAEALEFRRGLTYKKSDEVEHSESAVLRANNIDRDKGVIDLSEIRYIRSDVEIPVKKKVVPNSLLICTASGSRSHLGKVAFVDDLTDYAFGGFMGLMLPRKGVNAKYVYYFTRTAAYWEHIGGLSAGANINNLRFSDLGTLEIPLPPLEEQKQIVAVLDQAFAALDRARAHAEANVADVEELFGNWIASIFDPAGATDEEKATVGDVCRIQSGAGFPMKEQGQGDGQYPFYKVSDMNLAGNEWSLTRANNYIDEAARKRLRAAVFPKGSIVFPKVGGAISTNKKRVIEREGCCDNNVMGLVADEKRVVPEFLHEWLHSVDIYDFSNKANPPSITQGTVASWPLRVPLRDKQIDIVRSIKDVRRSFEGLRKRYQERSIEIAELRQSILKKAFSGHLT